MKNLKRYYLVAIVSLVVVGVAGVALAINNPGNTYTNTIPPIITASATPNSSASTVEVSGTITGLAEQYGLSGVCVSPNFTATANIASGLGTTGWSIDSTSLSGAFAPTQTQQGVSTIQCSHFDYYGNYSTEDEMLSNINALPTSTNSRYQNYEYSFDFPVDVSSLSAGNYNLVLQVDSSGVVATTSIPITVTASGAESFTPMVVSPTATYDASTQTVALGGTITDGTETFTTQAVCVGTTPNVYTVTGPLHPGGSTWSVINASGATLMNGPASYAPATTTNTVFGYVCQGTSRQTALTDSDPYYFNTSIDASALPAGSYTLKVVTTPICVPSFGSATCSPMPPVDTEDVPFTVPSPSAPSSTNAGIITVTSENAQNPSVLVPALWDLAGNVTNTINGIVCSAASAIGTTGNISWNGVPCSGERQVYSGLPNNSDNYVLPDATTAVPYYSFNSIKETPIAQKENTSIFGKLGISLDNIFSTIANAYDISPAGSQTLTATIPSAAFTILWTPDAGMQINPAAVTLDSSSSPSQTITITDDGAPGSTLTWTASANTTSGGNWLSAPSGGSVSYGAPGSATISYVPPSPTLANGMYSGTVTFSGYDAASTNKVATISAAVTLNVTNSSNPTSTPSSTPPIIPNCNSTSVPVNGTVDCTPGGGPGPGYYCTVTGGGTVDSNCDYTAPPQPGQSIINICSTQPGYTNDCDSTTITVTPPTLPACQSSSCQVSCGPLTASPAQIVVPESTDLQDSCSNVTNCQLTGGGLIQNYSTASGAQGSITINASTSPSVSTIYRLTCVNSNYNSSDSQVSSVPVTVGGSSVCEQNPNGAGCPGQ